jgi:hypothetical protein
MWCWAVSSVRYPLCVVRHASCRGMSIQATFNRVNYRRINGAYGRSAMLSRGDSVTHGCSAFQFFEDTVLFSMYGQEAVFPLFWRIGVRCRIVCFCRCGVGLVASLGEIGSGVIVELNL